MANTWETLDRGEQMALCRQLGANTPEDHNRIAEYLSQNPQAVEKAMKESGMVEGEEGQELQDGQSIESNVDNIMAESASSNVQQTGSVASDIPPAEPGESIEEYIQRLAGMTRGR